MTVTLSITQTNIFTVLRSFLISILPTGTPVFQGQQNRVSQPSGADYVEMTPLFQERMATNIDLLVEALFTGSISGNTLTITAVAAGSLQVGSQIYGNTIAAGTIITALGSGSGGVGNYTVNNAQTAISQPIQAGTQTKEQYTQVTMQLDIFGPNSADNAQVITTLFRDQYAADMFAQSGFDMAPLYTSDPQQFPFLDSNQQIETRWHLDVVLEANVTLTVPQQFAVLLGPVQLNEIS